MSSIFSNCYNLTSIICAKDWSKSPALEKSDDIFMGCHKLVGGMGSTVLDAYDENYVGVAYARPTAALRRPATSPSP